MDNARKRLEASDSFAHRAVFDNLSREYNKHIRKLNFDSMTSSSNSYCNYAIEILQINNLVTDLVRDVVTFNWDFTDRVFQYQLTDFQGDELLDFSTKIQAKINEDDTNFASAHSQLVADWAELGWGVMWLKIKGDELYFQALPPSKINYSYSDMGKLHTVFYTNSVINEEEMYIWTNQEIDKGSGWKLEIYNKTYGEPEKKEEHHFSYQPIFIVRNFRYSGQVVPIGRGLSLYELIKVSNNIYTAMTELAEKKINKIMLIDSATLESIRPISDDNKTLGLTDFGMPIYSVENKSPLVAGIQGSVQMLDNNADPILAQWCLDQARTTILSSFSINRLLVIKAKTEMTATEANIRHTEDKRFVELATKSFKVELFTPLLLTLFKHFVRKETGLRGTNIKDVTITWNDRSTKAEISTRLQEIVAVVNVLNMLYQFAKANNLDVSKLIEEVSAKTKVSAIAGGAGQNSAISSFAEQISQLQNLSQGG